MLSLMQTQTQTAQITVPKLAYSLAEVEIASGLSRASLYRLIAAGKLRTVRHGRRRVVPTDELEAFMATVKQQ
jgi:excisionase family DNA binding protein